MRDIPQDYWFALVFGAVWLAQLLYRHLRRKALLRQAQTERDTGAIPAPVAVAAGPTPVPARAPMAPPVARAHRAATVAAPGTAQAPVPPPDLRVLRRYSRLRLMPDRRAVQDAVVIAAILQPCHAQRPREDA